MSRLATIDDVMDMLSVKPGKGYQIIRALNNELEEKGFMTVSGRVPIDYLRERFNLKDEEVKH